jgi:hypothetical protein
MFRIVHPRSQSVATNLCRRGVSLLEVLGCILAVGLGLLLGARYFGINLHSVAYSTLNETEILEKIPNEWRPAPPEGEVLSPEEREQMLREELEALKGDVARLEQEADSLLPITSEDSAQASELAERRQKTLAFWSRLGEIRMEVERIQESAQQAASEKNVWKVLEIRRRAYLYGTKAIDAATVDVVDPQALQFAKQLSGWYKQGAELYGEAMKVWQGQELAREGLASDQLLDKARQQHDNEALLLFQKGGRLREVLIRRYQVPFPGLPTGTSDTSETENSPTPADEPY